MAYTERELTAAFKVSSLDYHKALNANVHQQSAIIKLHFGGLHF